MKGKILFPLWTPARRCNFRFVAFPLKIKNCGWKNGVVRKTFQKNSLIFDVFKSFLNVGFYVRSLSIIFFLIIKGRIYTTPPSPSILRPLARLPTHVSKFSYLSVLFLSSYLYISFWFILVRTGRKRRWRWTIGRKFWRPVSSWRSGWWWRKLHFYDIIYTETDT